VLKGDSIEGAIVSTICYLDIYACAPKPEEIHRFLVGRKASFDEVQQALNQSEILRSTIGERDGFYFLKGKEHLWARRVRFLEHSQRAWLRAKDIARRVEATGLARAGLVTGSLAADNCDEHADIDFLFIYPGARTWTSFGLLRLLGKLPKLGLNAMCPNYALPDDRLEIKPQNIFTAWEIAKAVPMFGFDLYQDFVEANAWVREYLPNALPVTSPSLEQPMKTNGVKRGHKVIRRLIKNPAFQWFEAKERKRKFKRDTRDVGVDMDGRYKAGSVDRHSPARPYQTLCELRYRMDLFGLEEHPLYEKLRVETTPLSEEMGRWGDAVIDRASSNIHDLATTQKEQSEKQDPSPVKTPLHKN
jgi:hypothetical protein